MGVKGTIIIIDTSIFFIASGIFWHIFITQGKVKVKLRFLASSVGIAEVVKR